MKISANAVVTIEFEMKNQEGTLIDSTKEDALIYLHGYDNIIPALEEELEGLEPGDEFNVVLTPDDAFGEKETDKIATVNKKEFETPNLEIGMQFQTIDQKNSPVIATVIGLDGDDVIIDENHPLAGMTLTFKGKINEVRKATAEEVSHGHIH